MGEQIVTVISLDPKHQTVTLKREGSSEGFYDNDQKEVEITTLDARKIKVSVKPGKAHWVGFTTFKNAVVLSDELMVTRPVTLSTDGLSFSAMEREYILLNAMPVNQL